MRLAKPLFLIFHFLFFTLTTKAQDASGFYVDGVKTDKIDCYSFDKLQIVIPYNSGMSGYDNINIHFVLNNENPKSTLKGVITIQGSAIKTFIKGNYIVYTLLSKTMGNEKSRWYGQLTSLKLSYDNYDNLSEIHRATMSQETKSKKQNAGDPAPDCKLYAYIEGGTVTSTEEKFDDACQCIKKIPIYTYAKIYDKSPELSCANRKYVSGTPVQVDLTAPCSVAGTKVDFNNLK